jgi:hypothetical protein
MIRSLTILILTPWLAWPVATLADDPVPSMAQPAEVALSDADLEKIRNIMVANTPVLASSAGIKTVSAFDSGGPVTASVVFHPHEQSGGISHAVIANCGKAGPEAPWTCPAGSLRSYLQLPGQEFEVRIAGDMEYEAALAIIEATRAAIEVYAEPVTETPDTAVMIYPENQETMMVGWGDRNGRLKVSVEVVTMDGKDRHDPRSWQVVSIGGKPWIERAGDH